MSRMFSVISENRIKAQVPRKPGTYLLLFESGKHDEVKIGKAGVLQVRPGFYLYVGSAFSPGGLRARLARHTREDKRNHWHIDYLSRHLQLVEIWFTDTPRQIEHQVAGFISSHLEVGLPLIGFGSSDCECDTHLFYTHRRPSVGQLRDTIGILGGERIPWERILGEKGG